MMTEGTHQQPLAALLAGKAGEASGGLLDVPLGMQAVAEVHLALRV